MRQDVPPGCPSAGGRSVLSSLVLLSSVLAASNHMVSAWLRHAPKQPALKRLSSFGDIELFPSLQSYGDREGASIDYLDAMHCPSDLKVFVYEYPNVQAMEWHKLAEEARHTCVDNRGNCASHFAGEHLLAQFSLEVILVHFFQTACVRTTDVSRADFFFVPFYGDIHFRALGRPTAPSIYEQALLDIIERQNVEQWERAFNVTGEYWLKWPERHVLVQPAPVTGLRHAKAKRGWYHYLQQLTAPVWISLELSRSFSAEYPRCSAKNIVMPYPVPGRRWHNGGWRRDATAIGNNSAIFAYCHAGDHGCANIRRAIKAEFARASGGSSRTIVPYTSTSTTPDMLHKVPRQVLMHLATFCPCPEGDSPSAKRQYDALLAGCVPVVLSDDALWAFSKEHGFGELDETQFALRIPEAVALNHSLLDVLRKIEPKKLDALRAHGATAARAYSYFLPTPNDPLLDRAFPDGLALHLLVKELEKRATHSRWPLCQAELAEPHFTLTKQYCGAVNTSAEVARLKVQLARQPHSDSPNAAGRQRRRRPPRRGDNEDRSATERRSIVKAIAAFEAGNIHLRRSV